MRLLRLFAAERLSPPVPSDGTCPLYAGGWINASLSGGCPRSSLSAARASPHPRRRSCPPSGGAIASSGSGAWTGYAFRFAITPCASSPSLMTRGWWKGLSATGRPGTTRLPDRLHRTVRDPTPTNRVTTWTRRLTTRTRSRAETHPHAARPQWRNAPAHCRYRLGPGSDRACSRPICARTVYPSCQNAVPQGQDRQRKRQKLPVNIPPPLCQYRAMLGETQKPILSHPRSAQYMRARTKQIPISHRLLRRASPVCHVARGRAAIGAAPPPPAAGASSRVEESPGKESRDKIRKFVAAAKPTAD